MAARATGSAWVSRHAGSAGESVRHGGSLADAVRSIPPLSVSLPGWVHAGEASGSLESLLVTAGDQYQRQWTRYVARALGVLEPVMILVLGGFVLLVALAILLPVMSANQLFRAS